MFKHIFCYITVHLTPSFRHLSHIRLIYTSKSSQRFLCFMDRLQVTLFISIVSKCADFVNKLQLFCLSNICELNRRNRQSTNLLQWRIEKESEEITTLSLRIDKFFVFDYSLPLPTMLPKYENRRWCRFYVLPIDQSINNKWMRVKDFLTCSLLPVDDCCHTNLIFSCLRAGRIFSPNFQCLIALEKIAFTFIDLTLGSSCHINDSKNFCSFVSGEQQAAGGELWRNIIFHPETATYFLTWFRLPHNSIFHSIALCVKDITAVEWEQIEKYGANLGECRREQNWMESVVSCRSSVIYWIIFSTRKSTFEQVLRHHRRASSMWID